MKMTLMDYIQADIDAELHEYAKHEFTFLDINLKNINKETSIILKIMYILDDLPQPDKEYIYELLRHWHKIR